MTIPHRGVAMFAIFMSSVGQALHCLTLQFGAHEPEYDAIFLR